MGYQDSVNGTAVSEGFLDEEAKQSVMKYASVAARSADAALVAALREGMLFYLDDLNVLRVQRTTTDTQDSTIGPVHGAWISYSPTWSGTIGNGSVTGAYSRVGRLIHFRATVTWGSTSSHSASTQTLTLPLTLAAAAAFGGGIHGQAGVSIGGTDYHAFPIPTSTTVVKFGISGITWSNTIPATFVNGNVMTVSGTYEAAADS